MIVLFPVLKNLMLSDLKKVGVNLEKDILVLKPFSKTMYGNYKPRNNKITLYVYDDIEKKKLYAYNFLFDTLLHEVTHYLQWNDKNFKREKNVMHNKEFYNIYNNLIALSIERRIIK